MEWWTELGAHVRSLFEQYGLLTGFLALMIDEAGVPMPVPGYVWPVLLGVQASQGRVALWQAILVLEAAALVGATTCYGVSAWAGRRVVFRLAARVHLRPELLRRAGGGLRRRGALAVIGGRLVPGLRIVTAIACGISEMPPRVFLPALGVGALLYIVPLTLLGYLVGTEALRFAERHGTTMVLAWLAVLVAGLSLLAWTRQSLHRR